MKTTFECVIRYADVDASMHLRVANLVNYILEASDDHAIQAGMGTPLMREKYNSAWIVSLLELDMQEMPSYYDRMEIETWVECCMHQFVRRNYVIHAWHGQERKLMGYARAYWTILDLTARDICREALQEPALELQQEEEGVPMESITIPKLTCPDHTMFRDVQPSDLDYNSHVNSCRYISYMQDLSATSVNQGHFRMAIKYSQELHTGETVTIYADPRQEQTLYEIVTMEGIVACTAVIEQVP